MTIILRFALIFLLLSGTAAAQKFETVKFDGAWFTVCTFDLTISSLYSTTLARNDFRRDLGPIVGVTTLAHAGAK